MLLHHTSNLRVFFPQFSFNTLLLLYPRARKSSRNTDVKQAARSSGDRTEGSGTGGGKRRPPGRRDSSNISCSSAWPTTTRGTTYGTGERSKWMGGRVFVIVKHSYFSTSLKKLLLIKGEKICLSETNSRSSHSQVLLNSYSQIIFAMFVLFLNIMLFCYFHYYFILRQGGLGDVQQMTDRTRCRWFVAVLI